VGHELLAHRIRFTHKFSDMKQKISIDVVSDVVCPWCYIGKRRLDKAVASLSDDFDIHIQYHPFELNPQIPANGLDQKSYLVEKFGGEDRYEMLTGRVTEIASEEGIIFDYDNQKISPNTKKLHAVIQFAGTKGLEKETVEILFRSYFSTAVDLSKDENIVEVAKQAGLEEEEIRALLKDDTRLNLVTLAEQEIYKLGISGVPFFIINKKYGISGAQSSETFVKALRDIGGESVLAAESCDTDAKNC
jgi:predicted DsbA family dithiol-disulfide isomerase